jgi:hypothetical protein
LQGGKVEQEEAEAAKIPEIKKQFSISHGITCWTDADRDAAANLASTIPPAELSEAILKAKKPLPGLVLQKHHELKDKKAEKEARIQRTNVDVWNSSGAVADPDRKAKMAQILKTRKSAAADFVWPAAQGCSD